MRVLQKMIPIVILAAPLLGSASSARYANPASSSSSDSDSVSIGTVIGDLGGWR